MLATVNRILFTLQLHKKSYKCMLHRIKSRVNQYL